MNSLSFYIGDRIRSLRITKGLTQEKLAEKAGLHNTYIGQVERGEKNITIVSLEHILSALGLTFSDFFESFDLSDGDASIASKCYNLILKYDEHGQKAIFNILREIDKLQE